MLTRTEQLEEALREIRGHMGACIIQRIARDDAIIFDHIIAVERIAADVLKSKEVA